MDWLDGNEDQDKTFSYNTKQQVEIKDRWLGFTNITLTVGLLLYIIFGVIIFSKGYLEFEDAIGAVATHVRGDAYGSSSGKPASRYFSAEDLTYPGLENGNVFVSTRQRIYRQRRGICEDHTMPCEYDTDCTVEAGGKCSPKGFCSEPSWCNVEDDPEIYELDVGNFYIWVKSSIQFIKVAPSNIYSTENDHPYPEKGFNAFTVRDLLMMCDPVPVRYEEISELGAAIEVQFVWECDVSLKHCTPVVKAKRIDVMFDENNIGYSFVYPEYITDDERMLHEVGGVRIFLRTSGQGRKISVAALVMKASTAGTLLSLAPIVADLLMLKVYKQARKYQARKYEFSQDFSDFLKGQREREEEKINLPINNQIDDAEVDTRERKWQKQLDEEY